MMRFRIIHVRHEIFDMAQSWSIDGMKHLIWRNHGHRCYCNHKVLDVEFKLT